MPGEVSSSNIFIALGLCLLGVALLWIARPKEGKIRFSFLKPEGAQILYTVLCVSMFAVGLTWTFYQSIDAAGSKFAKDSKGQITTR